MVRDFGFHHLSTGDLLREEQKHNGINAELIQDYITAGRLVPSEILVRLVKKAIRDKGNGIFLLDGFPRSSDNIEAWDEEIGSTVNIRNMIYFECSEKCMEERLLSRAKTSGRYTKMVW